MTTTTKKVFVLAVGAVLVISCLGWKIDLNGKISSGFDQLKKLQVNDY